MPAAFVSFRSRWGAAVCAQTQQSRDPTLWLTEWAPEPRDVYWQNLAIPYFSLAVRKLIMAVAFFFLTFFFIIPITFVQSLATIEDIEKRAPFLEPIIEVYASSSSLNPNLKWHHRRLWFNFILFLPLQKIYQVPCSRFSTWDRFEALPHISANDINDYVKV